MNAKKVVTIIVSVLIIFVFSINARGEGLMINDNISGYIDEIQFGISIVKSTKEMIENQDKYQEIRNYVNKLVENKNINFMVRLETGYTYGGIYSCNWIIETDTENYFIKTHGLLNDMTVNQKELEQIIVDELKEYLISNDIFYLKSNIDNITTKDPIIAYVSVVSEGKKNQFAIIEPLLSDDAQYYDWQLKIRDVTERHINIIKKIYEVY